MRIHLLLFLACLWPALAHTQSTLEGQVFDATTKEALPFVSIYLKQNGEMGAVSNMEGRYQLQLPKTEDSLEVIFQYIGYQTKTIQIWPKGPDPLHENVELQPVALPLQEVEVTADAEDPAYAIMRKVIARRKLIKDKRPAYRCKAYVKGLIRLLDTPEQIFGEEVGDLGGILDTSGRGVLYFSESLSLLHFSPPDRFHEQILATKVSGSDEFGFNSSLNANLDLYENTLPLQRPIVSPIADQALRFYRYQFEGSYFDESGREINRISCRPRQTDGPAFTGILYVLEGEWLLTAAQISITGASLNEPALDSLTWQLSWVPFEVKGQKNWLPLSQSLRFTGNLLGFVFGGYFINSYGEYAFPLKDEWKQQINKKELFAVLPDALEKGKTAFDSLRPLPLTEEEALDYRRKDSLKAIWESPAYIDSIDREANRFTPHALLIGYTHRNSRKWRSWGLFSPLQRAGFNAVQGLFYEFGGFFKQAYDKKSYRYLRLEANLNWGSAEHLFRPRTSLLFHFNELNRAALRLDLGIKLQSLNELPVPTAGQNELASLYNKDNLLRLYEKTEITGSWQQELWNGFKIKTSLSFFLRRTVENHSNYSILNRNKSYFTNHPDGRSPAVEIFPNHQVALIRFSLRWQPGQHYMLLPDRKIPLNSKLPALTLEGRWAAALKPTLLPFGKWVEKESSPADYFHLNLQIRQKNLPLGPFGQSEYFFEAGFFPVTHQLYYPDLKHFWGNRTWLMGRAQHLYRQFLRLPYFSYSTTRPYAELHWQHHFHGLITDRIPLLRKANISSVFSARALAVRGRVPYAELAWGWENIGFSAFRFWRIDVVAGFSRLQKPDWGLFLSTSLNLE